MIGRFALFATALLATTTPFASAYLSPIPVKKTTSQVRDIYQEASDMLDASLLMYPVAELRQYIRDNPDGKLQDPDRLLQVPITARQIEEYLVKHEGEMEEYFSEGSDASVLKDIVETIVERQQIKTKERKGRQVSRATLMEFDDEDSNSELVYAITTDDARQSVTVSFRGSVTPRDWWQDLQFAMKRIPNPLFGIDVGGDKKAKQPKDIRIHRGFYSKYLSVSISLFVVFDTFLWTAITNNLHFHILLSCSIVFLVCIIMILCRLFVW